MVGWSCSFLLLTAGESFAALGDGMACTANAVCASALCTNGKCAAKPVPKIATSTLPHVPPPAPLPTLPASSGKLNPPPAAAKPLVLLPPPSAVAKPISPAVIAPAAANILASKSNLAASTSKIIQTNPLTLVGTHSGPVTITTPGLNLVGTHSGPVTIATPALTLVGTNSGPVH